MNNINSQKSKRIEELSENSNTNKETKEHICKVALKLAKRDSKERLKSTLESSEDIGLVSDGQWQGYNSDSFWYHMQDGNTKKIVAFSIVQKKTKKYQLGDHLLSSKSMEGAGFEKSVEEFFPDESSRSKIKFLPLTEILPYQFSYKNIFQKQHR